MTFIIDMPLSLTDCSGRDKTKCGSEVERKDEDTISSLLIRHCHLRSAVVEIDKVW